MDELVDEDADAVFAVSVFAASDLGASDFAASGFDEPVLDSPDEVLFEPFEVRLSVL